MTSVIGLYQRFRHLIHEMAKFGVVGGIGFIVTLVGADLLHFDAGLGQVHLGHRRHRPGAWW